MGSEQPKEKKKQKLKSRKKQHEKKKEEKWEFQGHINRKRFASLIIIFCYEAAIVVLSFLLFFGIPFSILSDLLAAWLYGIVLILFWFFGDVFLSMLYSEGSIIEDLSGRDILVAGSFFVTLIALSLSQFFSWSEYYNIEAGIVWLFVPLWVFLTALVILGGLTIMGCLVGIFNEIWQRNKSPSELWLKDMEKGDWWE